MPVLSKQMVKGSNFAFSAVRPEDLGAAEQTLVNLWCDKSSSVSSFQDQLIQAVKNVVLACRKDDRSENIILRVGYFNQELNEVHGFMPVGDIELTDYDGMKAGGYTNLFGATCDAVKTVAAYAKDLRDQDFDVNAINFVITDGWETVWDMQPDDVKQAITSTKKDKNMESILNILIGVNTGQYKQDLDDYQNTVQFDEFVDIGDATPEKLAKLGRFVSKSISSQSSSLGSGGPSTQIDPSQFNF